MLGDPTEDTLHKVLGSVGIDHRVRRNRETPYAGFRVARPGGPPLACTASVRDDILRVTIHDVLPFAATDGTLRLINMLNRAWGAARAYVPATSPRGEVSAGIWLSTARATPDAVTAALRILVVGADCLASGDLIPSAVVEAVLYCVPPVTGDWLAAVDAALRQIGRPFRVEPGGTALVRRFPAADGSVHMVEVRIRAERLLVLRSWPEGGAPARLDGPGLRALNTLNGHLAAGCIVVDEPTGEASYRVELPLAWTMIDAALAEWLLTEAARAAQSVRRHLLTIPD